VEDNPANLKLVEQIIARRTDMRLLTAMTGNSGIEFARINKPEVILMDINLPGISGIEALRELRKEAATAHIPVIAISANATPHDIKRGMQAGFFQYITKPINVKEFMDALILALEYLRNKGKEIKGEELQVFPDALIKLLYEATLEADFDRIMELLHEAEIYDYYIVNELRALASSFEYHRLLELLTARKDVS